jgi:precorrin-6B methylase 2
MKQLSRLLLLLMIAVFSYQSSYAQDVPYVPTTPEVVNAMLTLAEVNSDDVLYDLGCGDGRIVVAAARDFGAKGVGVDSNPVRIKESNQNAENNGVQDKVEFHEQNLFETDISEASVIAIYLLNSVNLKLRPKFLEELEPGTRVVSHAFDMDDWEPDAHREVDNRDVYLWIIPENVSGTWDGDEVTMELDQEFQKVTGTIKAGDEQYNITEATLEGKNLTFTAEGSNSSLKFEGEIEDDRLNGNFSSGSQDMKNDFQATRMDGTKRPLDPTATMSKSNR